MKQSFNVVGMMCSHCEDRLKRVLTAADGISAVEADSKSGTAAVEFDSALITPEQIITLIEDAGFEVK